MDIRELKNEMNDYHGGFFAVNGYENSHGEVSNYLVNVKVDFQKLKDEDIEFLQNFKADSQLQEEARKSVLGGLISPQKSRSEGQTEAYEYIAPNVKKHNGTKSIFVVGQLVKKVVLQKGEYPTVNSRPLTIEKNKIKKLLKTSQYRQFCVGNAENIEMVRKGKKSFVITLKRKK